MSLQDQGAVVVVPLARLAAAYVLDDTYRVCQVGDHIELVGHGWGVVRRIHDRRGQMSVELFKGRDWIPRQPFPEWDVARRMDKAAERHELYHGSQPKDKRSTPGA